MSNFITIKNKKFLEDYIKIWLIYNKTNLINQNIINNDIINEKKFFDLKIHDIKSDLQNKIIKEYNYYENLINILHEDNHKLKSLDIINKIININNNLEEKLSSDSDSEFESIISKFK